MPAAPSVDVLVPRALRGVVPEIGNLDLAEIDLSEFHRLAVLRRLRLVVGRVDENAHPLIATTMGIDGTTFLSGALNFDPVSAGSDGIVGIAPLDDEIGMSVEVPVLDKHPRMLGHRGGQHVRQHSGHRRPQHVVHAMQPFYRAGACSRRRRNRTRPASRHRNRLAAAKTARTAF